MINYEDVQEGDLIELQSGKYIVTGKYRGYDGLENVVVLDESQRRGTFSVDYLNNILATIERSGKIDKVGEKNCPIITKACVHVWVEDKWFIKTYKTCKLCSKKWEDM